MKHLLYLFAILIVFVGVSCQSTDAIADTENVVPEAESSTENVDDFNGVQLVDEGEVVLVSDEELEYSRSVSGLEGEISYEIFLSDKNEILGIIEELEDIMVTRDYQQWRTYLTKSSITYWSNKLNLQILSTKLPGENTTLRDLPDYFVKMFIPARIGRNISEIRYDSPTAVKAVQVQGDTDLIFYDFIKEDGKWLVSLPRL